MTGAVHIRRAREADAPALAALSGQLGYPATEAQIVGRLGALASDPSREVLVAERGGRIVGWLEWSARSTLESGATAEISGLVVAEDCRAGGIGSALVERAAAAALERGFARLRVRTNETRTRTHGFYERLGFALVKRQRVYDRALAPDPGVRGA